MSPEEQRQVYREERCLKCHERKSKDWRCVNPKCRWYMPAKEAKR